MMLGVIVFLVNCKCTCVADCSVMLRNPSETRASQIGYAILLFASAELSGVAVLLS